MSPKEQNMLDTILEFRERMLKQDENAYMFIFRHSPQAYFILRNKEIIESLNMTICSIYEDSMSIKLRLNGGQKQPLILDIIFQDSQVDLKVKAVEMQLRGCERLYPSESQIQAWSKPFNF